MPHSAASVLRASSLVLLLLLLASAAAASAEVTDGDGSTTASGDYSSVTMPRDDTEMYICYLCTGRNPLLIRYCPIYWDYCHLNCYDAPAAAAAVAVAPAASPRPAAIPRENYGVECYVMKLYENGSYVIVDRRDCSQVATCMLSCGGGDVAVDRKALGPAAALPVQATAPQGMLPQPRVADFERCGTQAKPPPLSAVPGGA